MPVGLYNSYSRRAPATAWRVRLEVLKASGEGRKEAEREVLKGEDSEEGEGEGGGLCEAIGFY